MQESRLYPLQNPKVLQSIKQAVSFSISSSQQQSWALGRGHKPQPGLRDPVG